MDHGGVPNLKTALVGAGGWGINHARALHEAGQLRAVCDSNAERAAECASKYSVPWCDSVARLLESEFDAAVVCTPTPTHEQVAAELIGAGKHVLVEKPVGPTPGTAERLARMAAKKGTLLTAGYIERFNPVVRAVKDVAANGSRGQLFVLEFHRQNRRPERDGDVGIIHDAAVHDIDTAIWLFGRPPQVVFARAGSTGGGREDFASVMLGFGSERVAVISANWITPVRMRRFDAVFTEAVISADYITQEISAQGAAAPAVEKREPLMEELRNFEESAKDRSKLIVGPDEAAAVSRVAEAAVVSAEQGVPVYMEP